MCAAISKQLLCNLYIQLEDFLWDFKIGVWKLMTYLGAPAVVFLPSFFLNTILHH